MTAYSEETCRTLTQNCLEEFIKEKKSNQRIQAFFVEDYVHDHQAECCVMKEKCHRSMSKSEKPHEMKMILELATQDRTPCLEDALAKPGRDIFTISRLYSLRGVEFYEGERWCLYFKAPEMACS